MATRENITLPLSISSEIIQKTQESSAVMKLAKHIPLSGNGAAIPVILGDAEAEWVGEGGKIPAKDAQLATKTMRGHKLAVIVPFSNEFRRDAKTLYDALVDRLPQALAQKFDATVFGGVNAPAEDFDTLKSAKLFDINTDAYKGLVDGDTEIATNGYTTDGYVFSPQGRGVLLKATDKQDRPLFINNVAEGAIPVILGSKTELSKGAYVTKSSGGNVVGFGGDWTKALYGTVENVKIAISEEATIDVNGTTINLFQNDMFAVKAEIEVGFVADTNAFVGFKLVTKA